MNAARRWIICLSIAALVTTGCGLLETGGGSTAPNPAPSAASVSGTVRSVDAQARTLTVDTGNASQHNLRNGERTVLTYDGATVVEYQGQKSYNPQDLEAGDRIEVQAERNATLLLARHIKVISSVSGGSGPSGAANTAWEGIVRLVNTGTRTIEVAQPGREQYPVIVYYDANTRVDFQGRSYRPEDLERDDAVEVTTHRSGNQLIADQIVVLRDAGSRFGAAGQRQLRGTIRNVDTTARNIVLDSVTMEQVPRFDTNANGSFTIVAYDASTIVEYQGKRYAIVNLERGDVVSIKASPLGGGYLAKRITVAQAR
ncbi:MAG: DUF5666 domain-containing protein [Burkholderiales bacterium]